jgi:hypothetical protein
LSYNFTNILIDSHLQLDPGIVVEYLVPKYASFQSRHLLSALDTLFERLDNLNREAFLASICRVLNASVGQSLVKTNAVSNYKTLLHFVNRVLILVSRDSKDFVIYAPDLLKWQALLLDRCLAGGKRNTQISVISDAEQTLKAIFQQLGDAENRNVTESIINLFTGANIHPSAAAVSLGVVAKVCKQSPNSTPNAVFESSRTTVFDFFAKEIASSKVHVPGYVMVFSACNLV